MQTLKSIEGITKEMIDKVIVLGLIDVRDLEEVGIGPLDGRAWPGRRDGPEGGRTLRRGSQDRRRRAGGQERPPMPPPRRPTAAGQAAERRRCWPCEVARAVPEKLPGPLGSRAGAIAGNHRSRTKTPSAVGDERRSPKNRRCRRWPNLRACRRTDKTLDAELRTTPPALAEGRETSAAPSECRISRKMIGKSSDHEGDFRRFVLAKGIRVNLLAKELGVESKAILQKLKEEGLGDAAPNHMSTLSLGLAESVREWFSSGQQSAAARRWRRPRTSRLPPSPRQSRSRKKKRRPPNRRAPPTAVPKPPAEPIVRHARPSERRNPKPRSRRTEAAGRRAPGYCRTSEARGGSAARSAGSPAAAPPPPAIPPRRTIAPARRRALPSPDARRAAARATGAPPSAPARAGTHSPDAADRHLGSRPAATASGAQARRAGPAADVAPSRPKFRARASSAMRSRKPSPQRGPRRPGRRRRSTAASSTARRPAPAAASSAPTMKKKTKKKAAARKGASLSSRRRGVDGRRGEAMEKLKEFTEADLIARRDALNAAATSRNVFDSHLRQIERRGTTRQAKTDHPAGEPVDHRGAHHRSVPLGRAGRQDQRLHRR